MTLMLSQTCISFSLVLNTTEEILKNVGNQTVPVPTDFDSREKTLKVTGDQQLFGYPHSSK